MFIDSARFSQPDSPARGLVHSLVNSYCQSASAGIYSVPSLAPLANKVSQVEMEAGDCEGRLPPLFCQMSDARCQMLEWHY